MTPPRVNCPTGQHRIQLTDEVLESWYADLSRQPGGQQYLQEWFMKRMMGQKAVAVQQVIHAPSNFLRDMFGV